MIYSLFVSFVWLIAANAVVQLPPAGLYFQLQTKWQPDVPKDICMYSAQSGTNKKGVDRERCDDSRNQQFWTVYDIQSDNSFKLKNERDSECMFESLGDTDVGSCDSFTSNYYWTLDNADNTWFRLKNKDSNQCISVHEDKTIKINAEDCNGQNEQKWTFILKNIMLSVSFEVEHAEIIPVQSPVVIGTNICDPRDGSSTLSWWASPSTTTSATTFEFLGGYELSAGTSINYIMPINEEGEVAIVSTGTPSEYIWGSPQSETQNITGSTTIYCPQSVIEGVAEIWSNDYYVPFMTTLQSMDDPSYSLYSYGIWKKTNYYFLEIATECLAHCQ